MSSSDVVAKSIQGRRVAFVGKLGGLTKREFQQLVRQEGGFVCSRKDLEAADVDLIVMGADQWPPVDPSQTFTEVVQEAVADGQIEILTETQWWERLGLMEADHHIRRLYTPAMLAELLDVSILIIRRWHRRGLIVPAREVHRLPYFDFQEVATARRLAEMLAAGASPQAIEQRLEELARFVPDVDRPLSQLSVIVEGKTLLLRQGEGLLEPGGQLRIDFDALEMEDELTSDESESTTFDPDEDPPVLLLERAVTQATEPMDAEGMLQAAADLEDGGQLDQALEMYRACLAAGGPHPEVCFQLAELLYRMEDVGAARERYYMAIELDENFVEARANLGCVLAETGEPELAIAAFRGALRYHPDYPDAHYHLARVLDEQQLYEEGLGHWREFLALAPDSPWADQARQRLLEQWD
ncbi:MAG: tetratricopeptide repeat protein [Pirellulaceae bacterium]